jgi:hypothetical protein
MVFVSFVISFTFEDQISPNYVLRHMSYRTVNTLRHYYKVKQVD